MHREGGRCGVSHTDNRPRERYCGENAGKQGWLVRGWSRVNAGLQSFLRRWRQLVAGDAASVHIRLQNFPRRWLRQLGAAGASGLPKHNSEKEGKKRYLYMWKILGFCGNAKGHWHNAPCNSSIAAMMQQREHCSNALQYCCNTCYSNVEGHCK